MTGVYIKQEIKKKKKMMQSQWLQLQMKFVLGDYMEIVI